MFTGIIEALGEVTHLVHQDGNTIVSMNSPWNLELVPGQSLAHDGVCLTVYDISNSGYKVTAIDETLSKTTIKSWHNGSIVNLERCMHLNGRLDGHMVQGHVDACLEVMSIRENKGSYELKIHAIPDYFPLIVPKGSVTINGISLTVVEAEMDFFSVHLIPYTWNHTNLKYIQPSDEVNVEFDIIGKYLQRWRIPYVNMKS